MKLHNNSERRDAMLTLALICIWLGFGLEHPEITLVIFVAMFLMRFANEAAIRNKKLSDSDLEKTPSYPAYYNSMKDAEVLFNLSKKIKPLPIQQLKPEEKKEYSGTVLFKAKEKELLPPPHSTPKESKKKRAGMMIRPGIIKTPSYGW